MRGQEADIVRLLHVKGAIFELESYPLKHPQDLERNSMLRFACVKQLEIIGEAVTYFRRDKRSLPEGQMEIYYWLKKCAYP